jgi:pimeloyl-ACP methyl ester carboxylesterase
MTAAPVNGITIEYEVHGPADGTPLLLVMGLGGQLIGWPLEFVEHLTARGFRVIRYDNRDVGLSTKIDAPPPTRWQMFVATVSRRWAKAPYTLADMADDAAGLLDHLGIERAHVVGASLGGMIAQTLAIHHPARVASLASIMSNTGDRKNGRTSFWLLAKMRKFVARPTDPETAIDDGVVMFRLISGSHFDEAAVRQAVKEAVERSYFPDGAARQLIAAAASPDRTPGLRDVTASTLVIHGLLDRLVKPSGGIATAKAVPGARLVMYPDMGHDLPPPRWDEIAEEIGDNAGRVTSPSPAREDAAEGGSAVV